ncbi:hypothetical protein [Xenorhabdus santafensis]|nr:hypothetical protein [Xenorhabdus sp. 12]
MKFREVRQKNQTSPRPKEIATTRTGSEFIYRVTAVAPTGAELMTVFL